MNKYLKILFISIYRLSEEVYISKRLEQQEIKKRPKRKSVKKSKFGPNYDVFSSKLFDRVSDDYPELNGEEVNRYLKKVWLEMSDTQKARYVCNCIGLFQ